MKASAAYLENLTTYKMSDLLNSASLVMIPSGYKEDTVYSVVPSDGSGDLSFTRASNGTRVNSAGLVEVVPWNLFGNSEDGTSGQWGNPVNIASVTLNSTTAPNGTNTGNLVVENSANGNHWFEPSFASINGTPYTISAYFKAKERTQCALYGFSDNGVFSQQQVIFDLSTGTVVSQSGTQTNAIENVGNGWYRCSMTITANASSAAYFGNGLANAGSTSYAGNGTSGLYMWGRQLNTGTLKPYFPTTDRLNVPRLTYQNGGGGCPSLLLEKQSTNEANYSQQFDDSYWAKNNQSVTANATTSPDGTQNADLLIPSAGSGDHYLLSGTISNVSGQVVTLTLFVKKKENDYFYFGTGGASAFGAVVYQFSTNTFVVSGLSATATNFGNGWIRLSITGTTGATDLRFLFTPTDSTGSRTYNANGTDGTYIWGAQAEASSYPTSYIPTTSSSATRVADACFKTGISSLIGQTSGVIFIDLKINATQASDQYFMQISDGTNSNTIYIGLYDIYGLFRVVYGGSEVVNINPTLTIGNRYKFAIKYANNSVKAFSNGSLIGTDTSASIPTCSKLEFNYNGGACYQINDAILFPTSLTDAECQALTTL